MFFRVFASAEELSLSSYSPGCARDHKVSNVFVQHQARERETNLSFEIGAEYPGILAGPRIPIPQETCSTTLHLSQQPDPTVTVFAHASIRSAESSRGHHTSSSKSSSRGHRTSSIHHGATSHQRPSPTTGHSSATAFWLPMETAMSAAAASGDPITASASMAWTAGSTHAIATATPLNTIRTWQLMTPSSTTDSASSTNAVFTGVASPAVGASPVDDSDSGACTPRSPTLAVLMSTVGLIAWCSVSSCL